MNYLGTTPSKKAARKSIIYYFALAFVLVSLLFPGMPFPGVSVASAADGTDGPQAYAVYTADNETLTFLMSETPPAEGEEMDGHVIDYVCRLDDGTMGPEYQSETFRADVRTVVFEESITDWHPLATSYLFANFTSLESINGLENLKTDRTVWTQAMFLRAKSLKTIDLSALDLSQMDYASGMFQSCSSLEEIEFPAMDSGSLGSIEGMFYECSKLEEIDLSGWDTSNVYDMSHMFGYTGMKINGIEDLDTSNVTDMYGMFRQYTGPALDITGWDTSEVTDMSNMFCSCSACVDLSGIDTSKVTTMKEMFSGYSGAELDVRNLENNCVTDMSYMFDNCRKLSELDLSGFKTTNVRDMSRMFSGSHMALDLSGFNTSKVTDMTYMFSAYSGKKLDLSGFHISSGTEGANELLSGCGLLVELVTPKAIDEGIEITLPRYLADEDHNTYRMLNGDTPRRAKLTAEDLQQINISDNDDISVTPNDGIEYRYTGSSIFPEVTVNYKGLELINGIDYDVSYRNTYEISTASNPGLIIIEGKDLFKGTIVRTFSIIPADQIPQGESDPEADEQGRFYAVYTKGNKTLTFLRADDRPAKGDEVGGEPITEVFVLNASDVYDADSGQTPPWSKYRSNVEKVVFDETMDAMEGESAESGRAEPVRPVSLAGWFDDFSRLQTIEGFENLDTSKVTDMDHMLYFCDQLKTADVSSFDTSSVTDMSYMFGNCEELETIDVSGFDTSNVTDMSGMFRWCQAADKIDVSGFRTSNVKSMREMFYCCMGLDNIDLSHFDTAGVTDFGKFLYGCAGIESLDIRSLDLTGAADDSATEKMLKGCVKLKEIYTPKVGAASVDLASELYDKDHKGYRTITNEVPSGTYLCAGYGRAKAMSSKAVTVKLSGSEFEYTGYLIRPKVTVTCDGKTLVQGKDYSVAYSKNKAIGAARVVLTGYGNYEGTVTKTFSIVPETFIRDNIKYEVTNPSKNEVRVLEIRKNTRIVKIPGTFKFKGKTYKTKSVRLYAPKKNNKTKELRISAEHVTAGNVSGFPNLETVIMTSVKTIEKNTFNGKKKLRSILIKSTGLSKVGSGAFKGIKSKAVFYAKKKVLSQYKKKIKKAGAPKSAKYKVLRK